MLRRLARGRRLSTFGGFPSQHPGGRGAPAWTFQCQSLAAWGVGLVSVLASFSSTAATRRFALGLGSVLTALDRALIVERVKADAPDEVDSPGDPLRFAAPFSMPHLGAR